MLREKRMSIAEMLRKGRSFIDDDGVRLERDIVAEAQGQGGPPKKGWPMTSDALAVHPKQLWEVIKHDREHHIPTEYRNLKGSMCPVFISRKHRRDYARSYNVRDLDGGYGDP